MQLFTCKTSTTHFIFISNLTLCTAPSESIVEMPWIPLNSGSIMGPRKSEIWGTKHGLKLLLQLLEKLEQVPAEGFRSLFIPEAPTSVHLICPSDQSVPILAVVCSPHVCPRGPSMLPLPPPPVPSGAANFGTAALCLVSLTPRLSVAWGGVGGGFFLKFPLPCLKQVIKFPTQIKKLYFCHCGYSLSTDNQSFVQICIEVGALPLQPNLSLYGWKKGKSKGRCHLALLNTLRKSPSFD